MDDWFQEPTPRPTKHELYGRRLRAWGWLRGDRPAWEPRGAFASLMEDHYLPGLQRMLNQDLSRMFYGAPPWWMDPERPASEDVELEPLKMTLYTGPA